MSLTGADWLILLCRWDTSHVVGKATQTTRLLAVSEVGKHSCTLKCCKLHIGGPHWPWSILVKNNKKKINKSASGITVNCIWWHIVSAWPLVMETTSVPPLTAQKHSYCKLQRVLYILGRFNKTKAGCNLWPKGVFGKCSPKKSSVQDDDFINWTDRGRKWEQVSVVAKPDFVSPLCSWILPLRRLGVVVDKVHAVVGVHPSLWSQRTRNIIHFNFIWQTSFDTWLAVCYFYDWIDERAGESYPNREAAGPEDRSLQTSWTPEIKGHWPAQKHSENTKNQQHNVPVWLTSDTRGSQEP